MSFVLTLSLLLFFDAVGQYDHENGQATPRRWPL